MTSFLKAETLGFVPHGFFTREGFAPQDLGATHVALCDQVHSADVVTLTTPWSNDQRPKADAMVTTTPAIALGIRTADCAPVLFADAQNPIIGAAHAGWRGALSGILENTIAAMERLGARRASLCAAIGPCIGQASYEVGPGFPAPFLDQHNENTLFFRPADKAGHWYFDLPGYVEARLRAAGIGKISPSGADTCQDKSRFYSHRRGCLSGREEKERQISAIALCAKKEAP